LRNISDGILISWHLIALDLPDFTLAALVSQSLSRSPWGYRVRLVERLAGRVAP